MKLVSLNVSLAKETRYNDKIISTGIFKKPVDQSVFVSQFSLDGDQQVDLENHGGEHKAVYAFSANHYDHWRQHLAKPSLRYGQFGENLTITNLDEKKLCIGDQIQIGDCILEITQPRVPCFKLGIALDLPSMPKQFIAHGATGIYFRVISTGNIQHGDDVNVVFRQPQQLSVHTLFNAYFDTSFENAHAVMVQANSITELSDEWRQKVQSRL
ncbi:MAG: MOSC domain-containing protein [Gammaproteobacteria bacterium]|nr:MOSC domain-containing protein [Gammaproteobacteria bacterium]